MTALQGAALGAATGLRSTSGLLSVSLQTPASMGLLGNGRLKAAAALAAAGELVADKLPATPSRTQLPALLGRTVFGSGSAALKAHRDLEDLRVPAALGALAAVATTFAGARYRSLVKQRGLADLPFAAVEDLVAAALAWWGGRPGPDAPALAPHTAPPAPHTHF